MMLSFSRCCKKEMSLWTTVGELWMKQELKSCQLTLGMDSMAWFNFNMNKTYILGETYNLTQQEGEGHEIVAPLEAEAEEDKVIVGDMELTKYRAIRYLRNGCRYLGVSQAGSKEKMFNGTVETNRKAPRRQALEVAQRQYEAEVVQAEVVQPAMRQPTAHEEIARGYPFAISTMPRHPFEKLSHTWHCLNKIGPDLSQMALDPKFHGISRHFSVCRRKLLQTKTA